MVLILDTGGLIAFDRGDRHVAALLEAARRRRDPVVTASSCVAQAWRGGGSRQALLARLLAGTTEVGLDRRMSRATGDLCGASRTTDVVDAHVALLTHDRDVVLTSDTRELQVLLRTRRVDARTVAC